MIQLFRVVAPARSGTMWFSRLFTTEYSFCYHELSTHIHPYPSNVAYESWIKEQTDGWEFDETQRRAMLQVYPRYFARLWERVGNGTTAVGNSESSPRMVAGLHQLWPPMKFLFSVRNGINTVESLMATENGLPASVATQLEAKHGTRDLFEICCYQWLRAVEGIQESKALLKASADLCETTLESATGDITELRRIWEWVGVPHWEENEERNRRLMQTSVNSRVRSGGVIEPEEIWLRWTNVQRETFGMICGKVMPMLGYPLPA